MNIFILVLLFFSLLGFLDLVFQLNLGLKDEFERGLSTMGSLSLSMVGILTVGVVFIQSHMDFVLRMTSTLPFDASILVSALLAPDLGGYSISKEIAGSHDLLLMSGVLLSSILGQTISFQIPVFVGILKQEEHALLFKSMILGIIVIPIGFLIGSLWIGISFTTILINWIPILILCGLIAVLMIFASKIIVMIFTKFAKVIQYLTYLLFFIAVVGFLFPQYAYVSNELLAETMLVVFKIGLIVAGSLVLSKLILKNFREPIQKAGNYLGINEVSMIGLVLSMATSLAMLPLYHHMDRKGKMICGAFSVSGAYLLGGQLAYISSVETGKIITIYICTKLICGLLSILLVHVLENKIDSL